MKRETDRKESENESESERVLRDPKSKRMWRRLLGVECKRRCVC